MLKIRRIVDETGDRRLFEIHSDGEPASSSELERVARIAAQLVDENRVDGDFRPRGEGVLELRLAADKRTFFHDGIVFAALDAVNDPVRSPTLTRFAADLGGSEPKGR